MSIVFASPSTVRPRCWPGQLDEQRHERDLVEVRRRREPALVSEPEADAVIRGHDHERAVVQAGLLEPAEQETERFVGVAELKQVPLLGLERRPLLEPAPVVDPAQEPSVDRVAPTGREVDVRHVRQQRVEKVERRLSSRRQQLCEAADAPRARVDLASLRALRGLLFLGLAAAEVAPRVVDRGHTPHVAVRQDQVQVHDPGVRRERPGLARDDLVLRGGDLAAERGRAQSRQRLQRDDAVAPAEHREEVVRVLRGDRELLGVGQEAAEDRRLRHLAQPVDRRRVAVPGRPSRERGEVRKALGVDLLPSIHQRGRVELVERDQHDRRARVDRRGSHGRCVGAHELRDR